MLLAALRYSNLLPIVVLVASLEVSNGASPEADHEVHFEHCRTISDSPARLQCYKNAASSERQTAHPSSQTPGTWRLVRTPNPRGGSDAVSMMRTADFSKSDPEFAGLMLRCGKQDVEIVLVLIEPLPPQARPQVTFGSGAKAQKFEASVIPPGAALLLPRGAETLVSGPWQFIPELSVNVEYADKPIRGVVPLSGLRSALENLLANCPSQ